MAAFLRTRAVMQDPGISPPVLLTYYWDGTGGTDVALVTEAMARVRAFWDSFKVHVHAGVALTFNTVGDFVEETGGEIVSQATGTAPAAVTFTGPTDVLPLATQGLLNLSTGTFINGRRVKGRQFIPFPVEGDNVNGGIPSSVNYVAGLNAAAAFLGTTIVTPMTQRVWHRPNGGSAGLSVPVTARQASSSWATLKSRRS